MASVPAARQINGFEPPPSSLLATHVVHGNGVPDFDRDNFDQLLNEALGSDEQGHPNLGADVSVNHKLICIVFQVGIERDLEVNPFRTAAAAGKADSQLRTCLEVIQVAVERSPQVVFMTSDHQSQETPKQSCALYFWLIPRLLPLIASSQPEEVKNAALDVFQAVLNAEKRCLTSYESHTVLEFIRTCLSGETLCQISRD